MTSFKKTILFVHRWLGLITGLVVFIVSVTGCLFVFQHEITQWSRSELLYLDHSKRQTLPLGELQQKAAKGLGIDRLAYGLTTYNNPSRSWTAFSYGYNPDSWTYFGMIDDYRTVYVNPYNGEVKGIVNEKHDFFQIVKGIHWSLMLATWIGQPVVAWSTLIFVILLITGIVLWWPKRWSGSYREKNFKIKWKSTWRRINYDLHNVLGFYSLIIALILGITGLYWAFPTAQKTLYFMGTGRFRLPPSPREKPVSRPRAVGKVPSPFDVAYTKAWAEYPEAFSITFVAAADSQGTITANVRGDGSTYYESSTLEFDQYSGKLLHNEPYAEKNGGEKLLAMNYDIHVGAIGGIFGKIIAFLGSLVCASLPVTGFIIWWDREKRKRKRARRGKHKTKARQARMLP